MTPRIKKVRAEKVSKIFGAVRAVSSLCLEVGSGEVVSLMGPNGAGKSTVLSVLSFITRPTRGEIIFETDPTPLTRSQVVARMGFLSHQPLLYPDLTCLENLLFFARLGQARQEGKIVQQLIADLAMQDFAEDRPVRVLSRGQLQRVSLARSLVTEPDLLLLDEPAAGLDHQAIAWIERALSDLRARGGLAVVVTHELEVALRISTRVLFMRKGRMVADQATPQTIAELKELYAQNIEESCY